MGEEASSKAVHFIHYKYFTQLFLSMIDLEKGCFGVHIIVIIYAKK